MAFDVFVWSAPRDLDQAAMAALVQHWQDAGGDPAASPFVPNTDVGWFHRELLKDHPGLDVSSDAVPNPSTTPIWLSGDDEPPARVVAVRLTPGAEREVLESVYGLAMKYDLVVFDARTGRLHVPLEEMSAYASATFWPAGAIRGAVAGAIGLVMAIVAWNLNIPVLSGVAVIVGVFLFVLSVATFVAEARKALRERRSP